MEATEATEAEIESPYWRIEQPVDRVGALLIWRRLGMAVGPVMRTLRQAGPLAATSIVLLQLLAGTLTTTALLLTTQALHIVLSPGIDSNGRLYTALPILLWLLLAYAAKLAIDAGTNLLKARLLPSVQRIAEQALLRASLEVELAAFDDPGFYDQLHRARDRGLMHMETASETLVELSGTTVTLLGAAIALCLLHPVLLPILLIALLPEGWAALHSARLHYAQMPATIALSRQLDMTINLATQRESAAELRAHQAESYVLDEYDRCAHLAQQHRVELGTAQARAKALGKLLSGIGLVSSFVALGILLRAGWLPLAAAGTAIIAVRTGGVALSRSMLLLHELFEKSLYIADLRDFLEQAARTTQIDGDQVAPAKPSLIELEHVHFHYPGTSARPAALRDICLRIHAGQTIALVGENGSGKTTLAKLIAGLYTPDQGSIRWDGVELRQLSRASVADRIVMVLQEPVRWPKSARENVRIGRHDRIDPDDHALFEAGRRAHADEVIERLPLGWQTLLSRQFKGGHDLSGGQWQRMAIARGLFRDAPLLIWDEPTSSLDAKAELAVYESLRQLADDRTVILITHRLTSVRNADRIFFLEHGRLVEQGNHQQLLDLDGRYAQLYRLQSRLNA